MPVQLSFVGAATPAGNISERVAEVLRRHPEARNSYKALMFWYWVECDGLDTVLDERELDAFRSWFCSRSVTAPKTLQNRAMEIQNANPGLDACPEVETWRQRQSRAGVVK